MALRIPIFRGLKPVNSNMKRNYHKDVMKRVASSTNDYFSSLLVNKISPMQMGRLQQGLKQPIISKDKKSEVLSYYDEKFGIYLNDKNIKPILDKLKQITGIQNDGINKYLKHHMALRVPNIETAISILNPILGSGLYELKNELKSNLPSGEKSPFQLVNIGGKHKEQLAITLSLSDLGENLQSNHFLTNYIFMSIDLTNKDQTTDHFQQLSKPYKNNNFDIEDSYLGPAIVSAYNDGAGIFNHTAVNVNLLIEDGFFMSIDEIKGKFEAEGFSFNSALDIHHPDCQQIANNGGNFYIEWFKQLGNAEGFAGADQVSIIGESAHLNG